MPTVLIQMARNIKIYDFALFAYPYKIYCSSTNQEYPLFIAENIMRNWESEMRSHINVVIHEKFKSK